MEAKMYLPNGSETLYITEFLIGNVDSRIGFLFLNLDGERPVYRDRRIVLFSDVQDAEKALQCSNCGAGILTRVPEEIENEIDFSLALEDLTQSIRQAGKPIENPGNFLDCLQFLVDIYFDTIHPTSLPQQTGSAASGELKIPISPEEIPDRFYRILFCASQFFMFETNLQTFSDETGIEATDLRDAFKYALGDLMTNAYFWGE